MEWMQNLSSNTLLLAVASVRVAAAFAFLPVFSPQTIPPLVRNSIFLSMALVVFTTAPGLTEVELATIDWLTIIGKEAIIGVLIGFFFSIILHAVDIAGRLIDGQVGMTVAQVMDPLTGHQTSLNGAFLGRLANFVFMASGGFMLMTATLLESYAQIPILGGPVFLNLESSTMITNAFAQIMAYALMIAAPALVILLAIDLALGLVNRFAQQLNVFSLSLSIKAWLSGFIILLMLTLIVSELVSDILARPELIREFLSQLSRP